VMGSPLADLRQPIEDWPKIEELTSKIKNKLLELINILTIYYA
jgi:hypothetical protein